MKQTIRRKRHREQNLSNISVLFWVYVACWAISDVPYPFPLVAFLTVSIVSFIIGHLNMLKRDWRVCFKGMWLLSRVYLKVNSPYFGLAKSNRATFYRETARLQTKTNGDAQFLAYLKSVIEWSCYSFESKNEVTSKIGNFSVNNWVENVNWPP